ncbi:hypothetical protein MMPV_007726 [Pyropia vietnamensis]
MATAGATAAISSAAASTGGTTMGARPPPPQTPFGVGGRKRAAAMSRATRTSWAFRAGIVASTVAAALVLTLTTSLAGAATATPRVSETPMIGLNSKTADGLYASSSPLTQLLLQYGAASHEMTVLLRANSSDETVVSATLVPNEERSASVLTSVSTPTITAGGASDGDVPLTNVTFTNGFEGMVGKAHYTVTVETTKAVYVCYGAYSVGGFVMLVNGEVVSGDGKDGLALPGVYALKAKALHRVDVKWHSFEDDRGPAPGVDGIQLSLSEQEGPVWLREIEWDDSCPSDGFVNGQLAADCAMGFNAGATQFGIKMSPYRVGYGQFFIHMTWPAVNLDGEAFETVLPVSIRKAAATPCVAMSEPLTVNTSGGDVSLSMFNLLSPPQPTDVQQVILTYNGKSYAHNPSETVLEQPDQTVSWTVDGGDPRSTYPVTIGCDFGGTRGVTTAIEHPSPITISMVGEAVKATPHPLPPRDDKDILQAEVRLVRFRPWNYTVNAAAPIEAGMASLCGVPLDKLGIASIRRGSAIIAPQAYVDGEAEFTALANSLTAAFEDCSAQAAMDETCPNASLLGIEMIPRIAAVGGADDSPGVDSGADVAAGASLAPWAVALIVVLGALVALLVVAAILFVVSRRNAESTQSGASSSGPLGVPAPHTVLYSEGVVRDMYGRGPAGGPTEAAVAEREEQAEAREGLPRPPSGSAYSGGEGVDDTDGASSTYLV